MRLVIRNCMFLGWMLSFPVVYSQENILDRKIDIRFENLSPKASFKKLMAEADCYINFNESLLPSERRITKNYKQTEIRTIIQEIWGSKNLEFLAIGNKITIKKSGKKNPEKEKGNLQGRLTDDNQEPLPGATIRLVGTPYGAVTGLDGRYELNNLPVGTYQVEVSSLGFEKIAKTVALSKDNLQLDFTLKASTSELEEIVVFGKTEAETISEEAITITSLDIKKFQDQAIGTEEVLKTTTGLVVRQSGGLGSPMSINLNGLSGNAVRIYYDGIPMELYGNGLQLNTIPVDALERVDVYKGVMPIDLGTDALGGGLNLVPVAQSQDYIRTSYSFGSFNTHRVTFNGLKNVSNRVSLSTISYFNYSDNDYRMRDIPNLVRQFEEERIDARRFHNQHISGFVEGKLRIKALNWADRLEFAISYAGIADEIQNAGRIVNTAIGEAEREVKVFSQRIDYRKTFFKDKLSARYFGVLSRTVDNINDSTTNLYDWRGEILNITNLGGGEFGSASLLERENVGTAHRLTLNYQLTDHIDVKISDYYRYTRQEGEDPLGERIAIDGELTDPNTFPSTFNRNILGAELNANFFDDKLNVISFVKNYFYQAESVDIFEISVDKLAFSKVQKNSNGYGLALKYQLHPNVFFRTSVEQALRLPTERELLGDLASVVPNFDLEPEESLNWNLGGQIEKRFKNDRSILVNLNGFIRNRENLIRPKQVSFDRIQFINEAEVDGKGIELALKIRLLKNLSLQGNFTAQSNEIVAGTDLGRQVPNIPLTFYNVGATYRMEDLFHPGNSLQLSWTYFFIDRFSINTVPDLDTANPDFIVPEQYVHNAGVSYTLKSQGLAFSFNLRNVFNAEIFDNFRIPRPGINYAFKINYSL
ncbi:MAG: TonB-dependent receptor [Bacteroidota bacterium]